MAIANDQYTSGILRVFCFYLPRKGRDRHLAALWSPSPISTISRYAPGSRTRISLKPVRRRGSTSRRSISMPYSRQSSLQRAARTCSNRRIASRTSFGNAPRPLEKAKMAEQEAVLTFVLSGRVRSRPGC